MTNIFSSINETIEHDGFTLTVRIEHDDEQRKPWDDCGHGEVSDWRRADYAGRHSKASGEMELVRDGRSARFYDFAGACRKALVEGWDAEPYHATFPDETPRQQASRAALHDFNVIRQFCNDQWSYCGVIVTASRTGVDLGSASLWGIEDMNYPGSDGSYLVGTANELIDEALSEARNKVAEISR